jgi:hypothetical protein
VDGDSFQNDRFLLVGGKRPSLGSGDKVGGPQLLGVVVFRASVVVVLRLSVVVSYREEYSSIALLG